MESAVLGSISSIGRYRNEWWIIVDATTGRYNKGAVLNNTCSLLQTIKIILLVKNLILEVLLIT